MKLSIYAAFSLVCLLALGGQAQAQWGDLSGTFKLSGPAPTVAPLKVTKDDAVCGKTKPNEALVVGKDGGVANIIIWLVADNGEEVKVHPDYAKTENEKVTLDNKACLFEPHVAVLRPTQTLVLKNSDTVGHNSKVDTFTNVPINPIIPAGAEVTHKFDSAERLPSQVSCSIHPWMNGWLMIQDHPYVAVTDATGAFTIKNLPTGTYTFRVWQEKAGYLSDVKVGGKATEWEKGRVEVTVKAGKNSLGAVTLDPAIFEE